MKDNNGKEIKLEPVYTIYNIDTKKSTIVLEPKGLGVDGIKADEIWVDEVEKK
jgi:hypothetical protein